jgi:hypothetical protein
MAEDQEDNQNKSHHVDESKIRHKEFEHLPSPEELAKEARVTKEDEEALGPPDLSMDMNDDENLKHRTHPVDFDGKDLDIPGRGQDDDREDIGAEDEENNHYSLGSEDNDQLDQGI